MKKADIMRNMEESKVIGPVVTEAITEVREVEKIDKIKEQKSRMEVKEDKITHKSKGWK